MPIHRGLAREADVILGLCPGCFAWQCDYTYDVAGTYFFNPDRESTRSGFHDVVEDVLQQHVYDCPGLQSIVEDTMMF